MYDISYATSLETSYKLVRCTVRMSALSDQLFLLLPELDPDYDMREHSLTR